MERERDREQGQKERRMLCCPLTKQPFKDEPVVCSDGFTYDKQAILEWFQQGNETSPVTGEWMDKDQPMYLNRVILGGKKKKQQHQRRRSVTKDCGGEEDGVPRKKPRPPRPRRCSDEDGEENGGGFIIRKKYGNVTQVFETFETGLCFKELFKENKRDPRVRKAIQIYYSEFADREERMDRLRREQKEQQQKEQSSSSS